MSLTKEQKNILLGKNSYPVIVSEIFDKLEKAESSTLVGNELLKETLKKLNESITPMLTLRDFTTGAEKIAGDDVTIKDIVDFCRKKIKNGDLNFIINLCKEEHFAEMNRLNFPDPKQTIKSIESYFSKPSSEIEQGIKAGIFDNLKSNLLNKIKSDLGENKPKILGLNESDAKFNGSLVKYSPIGIKFEDTENNKIVFLCESNILEFDNKRNMFSGIDKTNISSNHKLLMKAINTCKFNPVENEFSLNESWDFDLKMKSDGSLFMNNEPIKKEHVKNLLLESIQEYSKNPTLVENFVRMKYLEDSDRFLTLMENSNQLIRFDSIEIIKNLSEGSYIMIDKSRINSNEPRLLSSSSNNNSVIFNSYKELSESINSILKQEMTDLFESQLNNEKELLKNRNNKISDLSESQSNLNNKINEINSLMKIAEKNSPAEKKLSSLKESFEEKLNQNIDELNFFKNNFKLY